MRKIHSFILGLCTALPTVPCGFPAALQSFTQRVNESGYREIRTDNGITFQWKADKELLRVVLSARTAGWVAVGFDPVEKMNGANFVVGYVKDGKLFVRDDYGTAWGKHEADVKIGGKDDVRDASGSEKNGVTEIRFAIPLDSGDPKDRPLQPGKRHVVILSFGKADGFSTPHSVESEAKGTVEL